MRCVSHCSCLVVSYNVDNVKYLDVTVIGGAIRLVGGGRATRYCNENENRFDYLLLADHNDQLYFRYYDVMND